MRIAVIALFLMSGVNREAVKTLALAVGIREAARRMGLSEERVLKWSQRDPAGPWTVQAQTSAIARPSKTRVEVCPQPVRTAPQALADMLDAGKNPKLLGLVEKREFLASAVRTPIGQVDESSPLANKVRRRTDKDGVETEEIESVSKLRALELDARLAGELDGKDGGDRRVMMMINIGILNE